MLPPAAHQFCSTLAIIGAFNGTHLGASLWRAATRLAIDAMTFDVSEASGENRLLRAALWHFAGRRPPFLQRFSAMVVKACTERRPDILIATGAAPLTRSALRIMRASGITCVNYSTDDPWNWTLRAPWHLGALPEYDVIFTTRRANIGNFRDLGCREVYYLPFGYDEWLLSRAANALQGPAPEILFVGGADRDRVAFFREFMRSGPSVALVGGYWERFRATRRHELGQKPPDAVCALTTAAKVNLCLVRHANRDGHVMRSFEIAALGGCMLAEDTPEHREIFGPDGEAVVYFRNPEEAAERASFLLNDPAERTRLSEAVRARISGGAHTYRDRLLSILNTVSELRERNRMLQHKVD